MKILFVSISKSHSFSIITTLRRLNRSSSIRPLAFPILAVLTPEKHSIETIDGLHEKINFEGKYDIVGISCMTPEANKVYQVADEFRRRGTFVVLGGWHPSVLPYEAINHADSVFIGEAEENWPKLLYDLENGKPLKFYRQDEPVDITKTPPLKRDIYPKGTDIEIIATRGCPQKCEFCSTHSFSKKHRMRPIREVIRDIESHSKTSFVFHDDSLTINKEYTKQLFRELKNLNKKFFAYGNINVLGNDDEFLKSASEAGCFGWFIGFESVVQTTLDAIRKTTNKSSEYISAIKKIHDYNMSVVGSFIYGFDMDTKKTFKETDEFIAKSDIDFPYCNILTPYPGSPLFSRYDAEKRILTKNWSKYDLKHVVFQPKNMTPEELDNYVVDSSKNWYKTSNILKRVICRRKHGLGVISVLIADNMGKKIRDYIRNVDI